MQDMWIPGLKRLLSMHFNDNVIRSARRITPDRPWLTWLRHARGTTLVLSARSTCLKRQLGGHRAGRSFDRDVDLEQVETFGIDTGLFDQEHLHPVGACSR